MTKKPIRVVISPETLEQIERDYPPEEVQGIIDKIYAAVQNMDVEEDSSELEFDNLLEEDPELFHAMNARMRELGFSSIDEWVNAEMTKPTLN